MKIVGVGLDLCKITRIHNIRQKPHWPRFVNRVLHENEKHSSMSDEYVASRWATKEAIVKATGMKELPYRLIEVYKGSNGEPYLKVHDPKLCHLQYFLSISHEEDITAAVVIAVDPI